MKVNIGRPRNEQGIKQQIEVKIHSWDLWNPPRSIALIAYPLVLGYKKKERTLSCYFWDQLPVETTEDEALKLWEVILDKIIFSLGEIAFYEKKRPTLPRIPGLTRKQEYKKVWADFATDKSQNPERVELFLKMTDYYARLQEGLELFGKYFTSLMS